jgi:type VI secretion system secreted protein VgrG
VGRDRTKTVDRDENVTVHNNRTERVDKFETLSIGEDRKEHVEGHEVVTIDKTRTQTVKMADLQNVLLGAKSTTVAEDFSIKTGPCYRVTTEKEIKLVVGKSSLTMNSDGLITLSGTDLNILGTGQIVIEAKGDVVIKGKNVKSNT